MILVNNHPHDPLLSSPLPPSSFVNSTPLIEQHCTAALVSKYTSFQPYDMLYPGILELSAFALTKRLLFKLKSQQCFPQNICFLKVCGGLAGIRDK